ncbi:MAG: LysM peptidoglycan-binding domain-containing protein [Kiritimatiellae bacterium]|nr:LysM peptidoglycan-binding domain-containing protein [Kiritimatiellia bacterium]
MNLRVRWQWLFLLGITGMAMAVLAQRTHTVKSGETLDEISKTYDLAIADIVGANEIANPNQLYVGQVLTIPAAPGSPVPYQVQSGDTLGEIALRHGTSVRGILDLNGLTDPNRLKPGQTLLIPAGGSTAAPPQFDLPANLKAELDRISVSTKRWKYVVVHHSATTSGTIKGMDYYHRYKRRMKNGLAYHFVIGNGKGIPDGRIEIGNRWKGQLAGGHLASENLNYISIGICLVGNFEKDRPTEAQLESLTALIRYLNRRCAVSKTNVKTHREINPKNKPTLCPGKNFPASRMRGQI